MPRLFIHVEGETEEEFVNTVLAYHLHAIGYSVVTPRTVGNARSRSLRRGIKPWPSVLEGIVNHLREDQEAVVTTMVDFYGLPESGSKAWPGRTEASNFKGERKALHVEEGMLTAVVRAMGPKFNSSRFVPFIVLHEFEGLLFSDCGAFAHAIDRSELESAFQGIRNDFANPEEINDSEKTAPSKRIGALIPYDKRFHGPLAALEIGLTKIRQECPHFNHWLERLESH